MWATQVKTLVAGAVLATVSIFSPAATAGPEPSVEFSSLLKGLNIYYTNSDDMSRGAYLRFDDMQGLFMPKEFFYTGEADYGYPLHAALRKADGTEVFRRKFWIHETETVFSRLQPDGPPTFWFEEAGDYVLTLELEGKPILATPLRIVFQDSDDPFNPKRFTLVDGPWNNLAYLSVRTGDSDSNVSFNIFQRGGILNRSDGDEKLTLSVLHNGDEVFTCSEKVVSSGESATPWRHFPIDLAFKKSQGGGVIRVPDLLKKDGDYYVVVKRNDQPTAVYPFVVQGGKLKPHANSDINFQPHTGYLAGRRRHGSNSYEDLFWSMALPREEALAVLGAGPKEAATVTAADKERWVVKPQIDAQRPFKVVLTAIGTRFDTHLAAGDGIVAYGTGSRTGVGFLRVGEDSPQTIPNGSEFASSAFAVCGKKLVLVRDRQLAVYDTTTNELAEIPGSDITLKAGLPQGMLAPSGYLVATINDPKKVDDRMMIKVLDVSGDTPAVITLKNGDFTVQDVSRIGVDAATGQLAFGSKRKSALFVAPVSAGAVPRGVDISGHDGFGDSPVLLSGGFIYYTDSPSRGQFRVADLSAGSLLGAGACVKKGYAANGETYAFLHDASPDHYVIGKVSKGSESAPNRGQDMPGTNGEFGVGESVAVADNGMVFVAGSKGLGSGEFLQGSNGGDWVVVAGPDGKPIPATDVTVGNYLLAFRTGKRNDTVVGYATFGQQLQASDMAAR